MHAVLCTHILALVVQVRNIVVAKWREDVSRYVATVITIPTSVLVLLPLLEATAGLCLTVFTADYVLPATDT